MEVFVFLHEKLSLLIARKMLFASSFMRGVKHMRKYILPILVLMNVMLGTICSAEDMTTDITAALSDAGFHQPIQLQLWGDTAACFAEQNGTKTLIVIENRDGCWEITINNPTALFQNTDWPELRVDTDNAIFWTYHLSDQEILRYHSTKNVDGSWGPVDQFHNDGGYGEFTHIWNTSWDGLNGGEIIRTFSAADENDNDLGGQLTQILPASWLADCIRLDNFDVSRFPTMFSGTKDNYASENRRFFQDAAAVLMPDYTFLKGMLKNDAMHFLMERPDGIRVYVVCEYAAHREARLIESSALPDGTVLGYQNFSDSLWIDGRCVSIHLLYNGSAGIEYIYDNTAHSDAPGGFLFFGDRTVWDGSTVPTQIILYGDHPWDDITQIDWNALPHSLEQASTQMDSGNYAMVVNPNPADRLHLRERADRGSRSHGKYYTGTPVGVSVQDSDWTLVVFGDWRSWTRGYMMKRYLTFGQAGKALRLDLSAMPPLLTKNAILKVYEQPKEGAGMTQWQESYSPMLVIGVIGDEWYHVWFPATGEFGFVKQNDLWEGNG